MSDTVKIRLSDEDLDMIGSFVKSPVFSAFKRMIGQHVEQCQGMLLTVEDHSAMLRLQGRIQGLTTLETLPALVVHQRERNQQKASDAENVEDKVLKKQREDYEDYARKMAEKRRKNSEKISLS